MSEYITDRAITNIWCNPELDNPSIFKLTRLTPDLGVKNKISLMGKDYKLPIEKTRCHVYQIGQWWPTKLNLFPIIGGYVDNGWIKLDSVCNENNVTIDLYTDLGIHHPLHMAWYRFNEEHGLFICVEVSEKININYRREDLYIRFYANRWFQSELYKDAIDERSILVIGSTIRNEEQLLKWQDVYDNVNNNANGRALAYGNGILLNSINLNSVKVGDIVEIVYDPTIIKVIDLDIKTLYVFNSKLDAGNHKYLLHYPKDGEDVIEYYDDNDFYILYRYNDKGSINGRYYHRNQKDSVRMVTHRDYSMMVDYVRRLAEGIRDELGNEIPIDDMTVRIYIRKSTINKPLEFENSRIHELYNLSDELIVRSMTGLDSVVDLWRADNLENSLYCKFMAMEKFDPNIKELAEDVYGYNAMSYYTGYTPLLTTSDKNKKVATLENLSNYNCTVYEYDNTGRLLGAYVHTTGRSYVCENSSCNLIEVYTGTGGQRTSVIYGKDKLKIDPKYNYRVYLCDGYDINKGLELEQWKDITEEKDKYEIINGTLNWKLETSSHMLQVRQDNKFLMYNLSMRPEDGLLSFNLQEIVQIDDSIVKQDMIIPLGELDIYLNGYNLIEGIDYYVDFPMVQIVNKCHLKQPADDTIQNIHVRFSGFCNSNFGRDEIDDSGFVVHGVLSNNNIYDIRSDKVLHIVVGGKVKSRDEVKFSEFTEGNDILNKSNGLPYCIRDIVVPLFDTTKEDTYYYRSKSIEIDKKISEYMTLKFPQPGRSDLSAIPSRYEVISPFVSKVLHALVKGTIDVDEINIKDSVAIKKVVKPYEYLLETDPLSKDVDNRFVVIHPWNKNTEVTLTLKQMKFVRKFLTIYGKQLINITAFLKTAKDK